MSRIAPIIVTFLVLASCAKDPELTPEQQSPELLSTFLNLQDTSNLARPTIAFAGNHWTFQKNTPELPVHVMAKVPATAQDIRFFESDSLKFKDSLETYRFNPKRSFTRADERTIRYDLSQSKRERFVRILYSFEDSIYLTNAVALRDRTLQTAGIGSESIEMRQLDNGYLEFSWPSIPATGRYLIEMQDAFGDRFMSLTIDRTSFQFYDLRFVDQNLTPDVIAPELIGGNEYTFHVMAITNSGWLMALGSTTFIAE